MPVDRRRADVICTIADEKGERTTWERIGIAVLMDIRDRLDALRCPNFRNIPETLYRIESQLKSLNRKRRCHRAHAGAKK